MELPNINNAIIFPNIQVQRINSWQWELQSGIPNCSNDKVPSQPSWSDTKVTFDAFWILSILLIIETNILFIEILYFKIEFKIEVLFLLASDVHLNQQQSLKYVSIKPGCLFFFIVEIPYILT